MLAGSGFDAPRRSGILLAEHRLCTTSPRSSSPRRRNQPQSSGRPPAGSLCTRARPPRGRLLSIRVLRPSTGVLRAARLFLSAELLVSAIRRLLRLLSRRIVCKGHYQEPLPPSEDTDGLQRVGERILADTRGNDGKAPQADGRLALDGRKNLTYKLSVCRRPS